MKRVDHHHREILAVSAPAFAQLGGIGTTRAADAGAQAAVRRTEYHGRGRDQARQRCQREDPPALRRRAGCGGPQVRRARRHDADRSRRRGPNCHGPSSCSIPTASTRLRHRAASFTSRAARSRSSSPKPSSRASWATRSRTSRRSTPSTPFERAKAVQMGTVGGLIEPRRVPRRARESRVRHGARELVRSRRRARRR